MRASTLSLLALVPLLAGARSSPPHLRHRRIANTVRHLTDSKSNAPRALVGVRDNTGHAEAKKVIKKSVKKRGTQCRARQEASKSSTDTETQTSSWTSSAAASATIADSATPSATTDAWSSSAVTTASSTGDAAVAAWAQTEAATSKAHTHGASSASPESWAASSSSAWSASITSSASSSSSSAGVSVSTSGVLSLTDSTCGWCGAGESTPNGSEDWLNCGLTGSGWTPPAVSPSDVISAELSASGVFAPCADYIDKFNSYAEQYGLTGIMLASFAMQESTCNPSATGRNGEAGLMQIASENCGGAPNGNCYDIDFNIETGAKMFSSLISSNDNNIILAVGSYNGWYKGLTKGAAESAATCSAQQNLDYLSQYFNGWLQGKDGTTLGSFFNLKNC